MAYVDSNLLEDEQEQGGPTVGASSAPQATAGAPAPGGSAPKQKTPGNFANLSEYLRVNQPQQFGQQIAGKIGTEIDAGNQVVDDTGTEFRSRVDANTVRDTGGLSQKIQTDPVGVDEAAFEKIRDAQYGGPSGLSDTQDLQSRVFGVADSSINKAKATGTESGRFALLDSYFGKPQYSQGQKTLDNLLIQNDPTSQQAFSEMRSRAAQLGDRTKALNPELQQYAGKGAADTTEARNTARTNLGIDDRGILKDSGALPDFQKALNERVNQYRPQAQADRMALPAIQDFFGKLPSNWGKQYSDYVTEGVDPTLKSVSSPDERARLAALSRLADTEDGLAGGDDAYRPLNYNREGYTKDAQIQRSRGEATASQAKPPQELASYGSLGQAIAAFQKKVNDSAGIEGYPYREYDQYWLNTMMGEWNKIADSYLPKQFLNAPKAPEDK